MFKFCICINKLSISAIINNLMVKIKILCTLNTHAVNYKQACITAIHVIIYTADS